MDLRRSTIDRGKRLIRQLLRQDIWSSAQVNISKTFLGTDYGGYCIHPDKITPDSVVYSAGIGRDIEFDRLMIERYGVAVHAFDPTPRAIAWIRAQDLPQGFHLHEWGLADFDGVAEFAAPVQDTFVSYSMSYGAGPNAESTEGEVCRLATLMERLGHKHVDILKMDIEGAECAVLRDIANTAASIGQILVEFHPGKSHDGLKEMAGAIAKMNTAGYQIFHVSPSGREYSFIRNGA